MSIFNFLNIFRKRSSGSKRIKVVCFDLNNTLCDYSGIEAETEVFLAKLLERDFKNLKKKGKSKREMPSASGILHIFNEVKNQHMHQVLSPHLFSRKLWVEQVIEKIDFDYSLGVSLNTLMKHSGYYEEKYWEYMIERVRLYPGTFDVLKKLRDKKYILVLLTDSDGEKSFKIKRISKLGLEKYFDHIITTDDTGVNKPDIKNFEIVLEKTGVKADECVMIGDHPEVDLINAKKLGFMTVWTQQNLRLDVRYKFVDYVIFDVKELLKILDVDNSQSS